MPGLSHSLSFVARAAVFLLASLGTSLSGVQAATFTVSNLNDSGPGSLRAAITAANATPAADTIDASSQVGTINLLTALPTIQNTLTLRGSGATRLIVKRNSTTTFRLFTLGTETTLNLFDVALSNGGGGLETGGAIANGGTLTLENCVLSGNAARRGGAIYSTGSVTVKGCTFPGNAANAGGAIASSNGFLTVTTSTFDSNSATDDGGALVLQQTRTSLASSTFSGNRAGSGKQGGAVQATGNFDLSRAGLDVQNCTFTGNSAGQGGALWVSGQRLQLQNATITNNTANTGAGVWSEGDTKTLTFVGGSIIAGNGSSDVDAGPAKNTFQSLGYNLLGFGNGLASFNKGGDKYWLSLPDLRLGALGNNGGPTQTFLPSPTSLAVNAIPTGSLVVNVDQRGKARPIGSGGDIGAVEADNANTSSTLVVNSTADASDGACSASDCTLREAIESANAAATTGSTQTYTITFDAKIFSKAQSIVITQFPGTATGLTATGKIKIVGPGANLLTLQGTTGQYRPRILDVYARASVEISGITFRGVQMQVFQPGGAIKNNGALNLVDCVVRDNASGAPAGGGIYNQGQLSLLRCMVTNNTAGTYPAENTAGYLGGGGICNEGTLTVKDSTIANNTLLKGDGGGVFNMGTATIENSTIASNSSPANGGGISSFGPLSVTASTVANNLSVRDGGGILFLSQNDVLTVISSTISGNVVTSGDSSYSSAYPLFYGRGSGIECIGGLLLRNSTIAENRNSVWIRDNAGLWLASGIGNARIENTTIARNFNGVSSEGALTIASGQIFIKNSVIVAASSNSPDVFTQNGGVAISGGYNFVGFVTEGFVSPGDQAGRYGNDHSNPYPTVLSARLGALADNGGQVRTIAPLPDSPLINMGDPNFNTSTLPYDARGAGFPRVAGGRLDIGAFETQSSASASKKPATKAAPVPSSSLHTS